MKRLPEMTRRVMNVELGYNKSITIDQYQHIMQFLKDTETRRITSNLNDYHTIVGSVAFFKIETALVNIFTAFKEEQLNVK